MTLKDAVQKTLDALTKDVMAPGAPPAAAPPPAAGGPAPAVGLKPSDVAMKTLGAVGEKVAALMQAIQAGNGTMPPNLAADVKTCVSALASLAGAAPAAPPPGAPPPAAPAAAHAPPGVGGAMKNDVAKAQLDPYTALNVTLGSVRDRMWCIQDLMRDKKIPEAKTEIQQVSAMMANASALADEVAGGGAAPAEGAAPAAGGEVATPAKAAGGNVNMLMTEMGLSKYITDQLQVAATEEPAQAVKRLKHLEKVTAIAKDGFEQTGKEPIAIEIEMETAYAPLAPSGGKKMDLTSASEQKVTETVPGENPGITDFDGSKTAKPAAKRFTDVHEALKLALSEGGDFGGDSKVEKSDKGEDASGGFIWPMDLNAPLLTEAEIQKSHVSFEERELPFGRDFKG